MSDFQRTISREASFEGPGLFSGEPATVTFAPAGVNAGITFVREQDGKVATAGGRVLAITGLGETITEARERAYEAVAQIEFEGAHYRRDIALPAVGGNVAAH